MALLVETNVPLNYLEHLKNYQLKGQNGEKKSAWIFEKSRKRYSGN